MRTKNQPLAYDTDIPGTRCGPEDGPWPRRYEILEDLDLWREMAAFAKPQSVMLDPSRGQRVDAINFQPCLKARTQDRYIVTQLDIHGRIWTLTGVFDGECSGWYHESAVALIVLQATLEMQPLSILHSIYPLLFEIFYAKRSRKNLFDLSPPHSSRNCYHDR